MTIKDFYQNIIYEVKSPDKNVKFFYLAMLILWTAGLVITPAAYIIAVVTFIRFGFNPWGLVGIIGGTIMLALLFITKHIATKR